MVRFALQAFKIKDRAVPGGMQSGLPVRTNKTLGHQCVGDVDAVQHIERGWMKG